MASWIRHYINVLLLLLLLLGQKLTDLYCIDTDGAEMPEATTKLEILLIVYLWTNDTRMNSVVNFNKTGNNKGST